MITSLDAYELAGTLHRSSHAVVSRYRHRHDGHTVVVKALPPAAQIPTFVGRLRYEYKILQVLAAQKIAQVPQALAMVEGTGMVALVMSDCGGSSLKALRNANHPLSLRDVLHIGHTLAQALMGVHQARVVHKDINPNNIVYNPLTGAVQLIDFDLASQLAREMQAADSLRALEGTLAYISPEQTGRMNVALDYRSDFYSLGVTLYELLTNHLPFEDTDVAQLVYAILAKPAPAMSTWGAHIPPVVADLVQRLMEKDIEHRYQTAFGLREDLATCLATLQPDNTVAAFPLARRDVSDRFVIPQRLYGREAESAQVLQAYERVAQGRSALMFVAGPSGIGKSALIHGVQAAMVQHNGLFASGKYDQLRRHIPFSALSQAVAQVVRTLLTEPAHLLEMWRRRVQEALGSVGQALVDVAPDLELLVGPQKPVTQLPPQETENRMLLLWQRLVLALCKRQPLVLFLDDLQWADVGTLKLIRRLAQEPNVGAGFMLIGAYRDNEVSAEHALHAELTGLQIETLTVSPLSREAATALIADTTHAGPDDAQGLADMMLPKTGGNPFFVQEFLKNLWERELVRFDMNAGRWVWELAAVQSATVTDNVAELVARKLHALPQTERMLLSVAACLGGEFSLDTLCAVEALPRADAAARLQHALDLGVLVPCGNAYRYAGDGSVDVSYRFSHDRVQQAAYDLLSVDDAATVHHTIGQRLLTLADPAHPEKWVFAVADHLNDARGLLKTAAERLQLVELNSQAGHQARIAAAYGLAVTYLHGAMDMLPPDAWTAHYALTRKISLALAEAEYLVGSTQAAQERLLQVLQRSQSTSERVEVHHRRILILNTLQEYGPAIDAGVDALHELHVRTTAHPSVLELLSAAARLQWALRGKSIRDLANAPFIADPQVTDVVSTWLGVSVPAFHANPQFFVLTVLQVNRLIVRHGMAREASSFGGLVILNALMGRYSVAKEWGFLVRNHLERHATLPNQGIGHLVLAGFLEHLDKPPVLLAERFADTFRIGLEEGQPGNAGKAGCMQLLTQGCVSLEACREAAAHGPLQTTAGVAQEDQMLALFIVQFCRAMQGATEALQVLNTHEFDEAALLKRFGGSSGLGVVYYLKLLLAWLDRDFDAASQFAGKALQNKILEAASDSAALWFLFYAALTVTQKRLQGARISRRERGWLRTARRKLGQAAAAGPIFAGAPVLLDAEVAATRGRHAQAAALYEQANKLLATSGHLNMMAAGWECAARYWMRLGQDTNASAHVEMACDTYRTWGARTKAQAFDHEMVGLLAQAQERNTMSITQRSTKHGGAAGDVGQVDLPAMMQVAQSLSGEVSLERLVQNILSSTQRVAGANRAALLLMRDGDLQPVADSKDDNDLPREIITYAMRTQEPVVINDVPHQSLFRDPYLARAKPKALLAAPLLFQNKVQGLIYLENTVATGTFGPGRLNLVKFLAAQAASALETTTLYGRLEHEVGQRTAQLQQTHARLVQLEKQSTEMQMAGGFAHEMRNALSTAQYPLAALLHDNDSPALLTSMEQAVRTLHSAQQNPALLGGMPNVFRDLQRDQALLSDAVSAIDLGVQRALKITKQILEYAEVSRMTPGDDSVALSPMVDRLLQEFADSFAAAHIATFCDVDARLRVLMREDHASTVLRNLLSNARDAVCAAADGQPRRIDVGVVQVGGGIVLQVSDTGVGMSAEVQKRVFEPFFSTKGAQGSGLGLGFCKKLLHVYGGDIEFAPRLPAGTVFRVKMPPALR